MDNTIEYNDLDSTLAMLESLSNHVGNDKKRNIRLAAIAAIYAFSEKRFDEFSKFFLNFNAQLTPEQQKRIERILSHPDV